MYPSYPSNQCRKTNSQQLTANSFFCYSTVWRLLGLELSVGRVGFSDGFDSASKSSRFSLERRSAEERFR
jgi:hypothetical protein